MTCPHGMPKPSTCLDCMEEGTIDNEWRKVGAAFGSKYGQDCAGCGIRIAPTQLVQRWDRGDPPTATAYTHPECSP